MHSIPGQWRKAGRLHTHAYFSRPTPCGFRQVVQQLSKPVANDINYLIRIGANAVVAAKVNWKNCILMRSFSQPELSDALLPIICHRQRGAIHFHLRMVLEKEVVIMIRA